MTLRRATAAALAALCAFLPSSEGWAAGARSMGGPTGSSGAPAASAPASSLPSLPALPPGLGNAPLSGAAPLSRAPLPGTAALPPALPAFPASGAAAGLPTAGLASKGDGPAPRAGTPAAPGTPASAPAAPAAPPAAPAASAAAGTPANSEQPASVSGKLASELAELDGRVLFDHDRAPTRGETLKRWTGLLTGYRAVRSVVGYPAVERAVDDLLQPGALAVQDRRDAARRLAALNRPETLEALASAAVSDADTEVRYEARASLAAVAGSWQGWLLRESALHPLAGRRIAALRALGAVARVYEAPAAVERLAAAASRDRDEGARLTALQQLGHARSPKASLELARLHGVPGERELAKRLDASLPEGHDRDDARMPLHAGALKKVIAIGAFFAGVELVGGLVTRSMSLQADAMHLAADLAINAGALAALWIARRPATSKRASARKIEPLMGLASATAIAGMGVFTAVEAASRLMHPAPVPALETMILACAGLTSNALSTWLLYRYREESLSLKGAFVHSATDAIGSLGIILGSALILAFGWLWADPLISFAIVALILHTTWELAERSWKTLRAAK